ncbi:MAG: hypothetical protein RL701_3672 [Pseudomonadota bacterium]|jgi:hypothetical protein
MMRHLLEVALTFSARPSNSHMNYKHNTYDLHLLFL